jgi:hypothetical protein
MALFVGVAVAQEPDFGYYPNEIGLYTTMTPASAADTYIDAPGGFGGFPVFLLISNPVDENTGSPIATLGGYELSIVVPGGWSVNPLLPAGTTDFDGQPNHFYVSGLIPVGGAFTKLCDITIGSFGGGQSGGIFLTPYANGTPSIEGHMAVTNADDNFVISRAYPISGSYDAPVAGINLQVVDSEDVSWGDVKSLFK